MPEYRTFDELMALAREVKATESGHGDTVEKSMRDEMAYWKTVSDAMGLGLTMALNQDASTGRLPPQHWHALLTFHPPGAHPATTKEILVVRILPRFRDSMLGDQPIIVPNEEQPVRLYYRGAGDSFGTETDRQAVIDALQARMREYISRAVGLHTTLR